MRGGWRITSFVCCIFAACVLTSAAFAQGVDDRYEFLIDGGALGTVMEKIHKTTGIQLLFSYDLVEFEGVNAVNGQYTVQEAMAILLHNTGLTSGLTESGMIVITRENSAIAHNREDKMTDGKLKKGLLASVAAFMFSGANAQGVETVNDDTAENQQEKDVVIVTGTNIRGVSPDSSPSQVFDREDIDKTGFSTVTEFVQSLPQNFGGGASADTSLSSVPNDRTSGGNLASGSSVNLRGLGSGSTLVLLNGTRLAPSGSLGDFVDISMIPLSAVERVEVLTDGASAIYGADAISGVVNFVLRDDYEGAETLVRVGNVTEGEMSEYRVGQTFGGRWDGGNALISYEFLGKGSLRAQERDFAMNSVMPFSLLPSQKSHSVLLAGSQELSDRVTFSGHATFSQRAALDYSNFAGGARTFTRDSKTKNYGGAAGIDVDVGGDWVLNLSGSYNDVEAATTIEGGLSDDVIVSSNLWSLDGKLDGTVTEIAGGEIKLATGVSYRQEKFSWEDILPPVRTLADDSRSTYGVFAEAFIPLAGPANRRPGLERLELSVAGRFDHYNDFGDTFNPKVGLLWAPFDDLRFRGTFGTSFNPPNLGDVGSDPTRGFIFARFVPNPPVPGGSLTIVDGRINPDLRPEEATSWTAGVDYTQEVGDGLFDLSATWFRINYTDRIGKAGLFFQYLSDPMTFAPVTIADPDPAFIAGVIADIPAARFFNVGGAWTTPGDEDFYIDNRLLNLSGAISSGIDVNFSYSIDDDAIGALSVGVSGTYLLEQSQQITASAPFVERVDTVFNPVDYRLRSNISWSKNGIGASAFVNYVDSYVDNRNILGTGDVKVDSLTTVDLNLSYDTGDRSQHSLLNGNKFSLSVINLFDQQPPALAFNRNGARAGYDPTNSSPVGRFISFQITKTW